MKHTFLTIICLIASIGIFAQEEVNTRRLGVIVPPTGEGVMVEAVPNLSIVQLPRRAPMTDDFNTEGTSFWVTFMQNYLYTNTSSELKMQLVFSSRYAASIKVSNPNTGWSTNSSVSANGVTIITVPTKQCYNAQAKFDYYYNMTGYISGSDGPQNTGLYIESSAPISVYGSNYASCTFDATNVLPEASLGTDYVIQAYRTQIEGNTEFAIVATEDNTTVTIALSANSLTMNKSTFTIKLNKGQVYQSVTSASKGTLGGTVIQADKKIAVFNGDIDAYVPDNKGYCDHMCEQAMPIQTWGKKFVVTKTYGQNMDVVMFTAIKDGTTIRKNGTIVATLNTCQHYTYRMTENALYFETSEPCACYIYQSSRTANTSQLGDPSMVWITPQEQGIKQITFATFKTAVTQYHYVNVVCPTSAVGSMTLDGELLKDFVKVPGNDEYSYICKKINHGTHTLYNPNEEFVAHVYGKGVDESYAYCVGGYLRQINDVDVEDIIEHETVEQTYDICEGQSVTINGTQYSEATSFLDTIGNTIKKYTIVVHNSFLKEETIEFTEGEGFYWRGKYITTPGTYKDPRVSKWGCDSIFKLIAKYDNVTTTYDTVCANAFYKFRGQSFALPDGPFPMDYTIKKTEGDWEYHQQLRILPSVAYYNDSYILGPNEVYNYHGINISSAGDYTVNLTSRYGCDSIVTLKVTQPISTRSYYAICQGESYNFGGTDYSTSGTYQYETTASDGSKKVHELILTVHPLASTVLNATICEGESYLKNGFSETEAGTYYKYLKTVNGCDSTVTLNLSIHSPESQTIEDSFCKGTTYSKYGFNVTRAGTHVRALRDQYGCDSTITLILTEKPTYRFTENIVLIDDETKMWHNQLLDHKGTYTATYTTVDGCDSIFVANVRKVVGVTEEVYDTLCTATSYTYRGQTFDIPTSDVHPFDFVMEVRDLTECKRYRMILTLMGGTHYPMTYELGANRTIKHNGEIVSETHPSYTLGTQVITHAGEYSETFVSASGCDSIVDLTVTQPIITDDYEEKDMCAGGTYYLGTIPLTHPGTYVDSTYDNVKKGYDITTVKLNIRPLYSFEIDTVIQTGETYIDDNFNKSTPGKYSRTYESKFECDSIYILKLKVCTPVEVPIYATINDGEAYDQNGFLAYTAGTYSHVNTSAAGCDSTTTLHLTVLPKIAPTYVDTAICEGGSILWEGDTYHSAGTYPKTFIKDGRDSVRILRLSVVPVYDDTIYASICQGEAYTLYNFNHSTTGTYTQTNKSIGGCDSLMTLELKVNPTYSKDIYAEICEGDVYNQYGLSTNTPGNYERKYTTDDGCDSILNIHISMKQPSMSVTQVTIKPGEKYTWLGHDYTDTYYKCDTIVNKAGCDSIRIIDIFMDKYILTSLDTAFCEGDSMTIFGDTIVKTEGFYMRTYKLASGADSIVTWGVTILEHTDSVTQVTLHKGETFNWHGHTYDQPTTQYDTLVNVAGCDSICRLELDYTDLVVTNVEESFCQGDSLKLWNDSIVKTPGTYQRILAASTPGKDSLVIYKVDMRLPSDSVTTATINQGESFTWHGNVYTTTTTVRDTLINAVNCDSICTLNLTVNRQTYQVDSTICENTLEDFNWEGLHFTKDNLTKEKTFTTSHGDSIVEYTVHLNPVTGSTTLEIIATGQTFEWHGTAYTRDTTVYDTIANHFGCDSICTFTLQVTDAPIYYDSASVCENDIDEFTWEDNHFALDKLVASKTFSTPAGDSVVKFTVILLPSFAVQEEREICPNELPYTWNGLTFNAEGSQEKVLKTYLECDSVVTYTVKLKECTQPCVPVQFTATIDSICANDTAIVVNIHPTQGQIVASSVRFSAEARNHGFHDTTANVSQDGKQIFVPLRRIGDSPNYPRPDTYAMVLTIQDSCGNAYTDSVTYKVLYPSWVILQRWNDVLAMYNEKYNGGYTFSKIRWFHNGTEVEGRGEHNSYIYAQPTLIFGDDYWAELTRSDDGKTIRTCSCQPIQMNDETSFKDAIRMLPRYSNSSRIWHVQSTLSGHYIIYDTAGKRIQQGHFGEQYDSPDILMNDYPTGTYIVLFVSDSGVNSSQKILVKD